MDPSSVHHGGPALRVSSSFSGGSLDSFFADINHFPPLLSESVTLDSLSSKSSVEIIPAAFHLTKSLPRCILLGLGENLKFFSEVPSQGGSPRRPTRVVISSPTSPRLRMMLKECLSIQQWAENSSGWQAPGHTPWSEVKGTASTQPWTPEGSVLPADLVSAAVLQARTRRNPSLESRNAMSSSSSLIKGRPYSTSEGRGDVVTDDIIDIMQELTEFQYYFETLPREADLDLDGGSGKLSSSPTLAVPSLVISDSHFSFPLPLESSQSISHSRPISLARRRGKTAPAPLLAPSKTMADIAYPDIPTAFLGTPSKEISPLADTPVSAPHGDLKSSLPFEAMIHNLRLQCATMEVRSPPVDATWNSRSAEASPRKVTQRDTLPCRTQSNRDGRVFEKPLLVDIEKPSLARKPTKRLAKNDRVESRRKPDKITSPLSVPQKPSRPSPTRKPPPVHTPADLPVESRSSITKGRVGVKRANIADATSPPVTSRPRHSPLDSGARVVSLPQEKLQKPKTQISRKDTLSSRKTSQPTSKIIKVPTASSISVPGNSAPDSHSFCPSSDCSTPVPKTSSHGDSESWPSKTRLLPIDNATNRGPDPLAPDSALALRSAFLKKNSEKSASPQPVKTVRFALPSDELEEGDSLWSGPSGPVVEIPRPVAPFAKTLEEEDARPKQPVTAAASSHPSVPKETPSLLHRSGSLVRKASWRVLPSTRMAPSVKTRPHSVAIGSPLRQSMTIPDLPDINAPDADDDEHTPLIGTRRTTHSLSRHSLSRIMSLRHPMFSGGGKENKRATIAISSPTGVKLDENAMRRGMQAPNSIDTSAHKKSRMPVPLRNILTRFK